MSGHTYQEYPKWKYHRKLGSKIVHNAEEEKALSDTWYDNPSESADTSQFSASHWPVRWPVSTLRSESFLAFRGQIRLKTSRQLREVKSIRLPTCKPNFDGHLYRKARPFSAVTAANMSTIDDVRRAEERVQRILDALEKRQHSIHLA